jgi:hypothetical protein
MAGLADQVNDGPMIVAALKMGDLKLGRLLSGAVRSPRGSRAVPDLVCL